MPEERTMEVEASNGEGVPSQISASLSEPNSAEEEQQPPRRNKKKNSGGSLGDVYKRQHQVLATSRRKFEGRQAARDEQDENDGHRFRNACAPLDRAHDNFQEFRYRCGVIVNSEFSQFFIVYLIALNAIMMGIATFDFVQDNPKVDDAFEIVDTVFLIIFTVELAMQFAFYGWRLIFDGWLVFDLIIITLSWAFASVQIIRAFRIFRAFRLITRIKVLKNLVLALFSVVPRMFAIGILLMLVSYIFAVMFTQLFKHLHEGEIKYTDDNYFGSMGKTFFTLFQIMTLDNWADIARQVMAAPDFGWAWLPFIVFVIVTGFVVVNLIIAVICDAISALHDDEKAKLHGTFAEGEEGESGDQETEEHPALQQDIQEQLAYLEQHVKELARMQNDSLMTLELLTSQLHNQRNALAAQDYPAGNRKT